MRVAYQACWLDAEVAVSPMGRDMIERGELVLVACAFCTRRVWWWPGHHDPVAVPICARPITPTSIEPDLDSCFARIFLGSN